MNNNRLLPAFPSVGDELPVANPGLPGKSNQPEYRNRGIQEPSPSIPADAQLSHGDRQASLAPQHPKHLLGPHPKEKETAERSGGSIYGPVPPPFRMASVMAQSEVCAKYFTRVFRTDSGASNSNSIHSEFQNDNLKSTREEILRNLLPVDKIKGCVPGVLSMILCTVHIWNLECSTLCLYRTCSWRLAINLYKMVAASLHPAKDTRASLLRSVMVLKDS